jgi:hypothetical protein
MDNSLKTIGDRLKTQDNLMTENPMFLVQESTPEGGYRFVTACLTRKGCEDYIASNGHNFKKPRIYVGSGFRNQKWADIRNQLMALSDAQ